MERLDSDRELQSWENDYQPWQCLLQALSSVAPQAIILFMVWWSVSEVNARAYQVVSYCGDSQVAYSYACEATKASARAFPLVGMSIAMIVTGRYILQRRIFYVLLIKGALLDFTNYEIHKDNAVMIVGASFLFGVLHFILAFIYAVPAMDQLTAVFGDYIPKCAVFFVAFHGFCNVENYLVTMPKFFEENFSWGKTHIAQAEFFDELSIYEGAKAAREHLSSDGYSLDEVLELTIKGATQLRDSHAGVEDHHGKSSFAKGFRPGRVLMDHKLNDPASKSFRRAFCVYAVLFVLVQTSVVMLLIGRVEQEFSAAFPSKYNWQGGAVWVDGENYDLVGDGHCRDGSLRRPIFQYIRWEDLEEEDTNNEHEAKIDEDGSSSRKKRGGGGPLQHSLSKAGQELRGAMAKVKRSLGIHGCTDDARGHCLPCARACNDRETCIGFAIDPDACTNYFSQHAAIPPGWFGRGNLTMSTEDEHNVTRIVRVKGGDGASMFTGIAPTRCWRKVAWDPRPACVAGIVVYALHLLFVLWAANPVIRKIFLFWMPGNEQAGI